MSGLKLDGNEHSFPPKLVTSTGKDRTLIKELRICSYSAGSHAGRKVHRVLIQCPKPPGFGDCRKWQKWSIG